MTRCLENFRVPFNSKDAELKETLRTGSPVPIGGLNPVEQIFVKIGIFPK